MTPLHLYYSMIKVRVSINYIQTLQVLISQNLDNMEKNMTSVTPTSELDDGLTTLLLAALTVTGIIMLTVLLIISLLVISCFVKHSR